MGYYPTWKTISELYEFGEVYSHFDTQIYRLYGIQMQDETTQRGKRPWNCNLECPERC
jgi:hypothetical protein